MLFQHRMLTIFLKAFDAILAVIEDAKMEQTERLIQDQNGDLYIDKD